MDIVDKYTRSKMMAGIKSKNTSPEMQLRKALFARGYRYRLHDKTLPGKPDLVFPKYRAVIFVNGCFWHGHNCHLFRLPKSNIEFWEKKISRNQQVDSISIGKLSLLGWRVALVWECTLKGKCKLHAEDLISQVEFWLLSTHAYFEIPD